MSDLAQAEGVLSVVAAVFAVAVAWRRPQYRPVAGLLVLGVVLGVVRPMLREYAPWGRVGEHLRQALYLLWTPAVAAVAAVVFGRRRDARLPAILWAGAVVLLVSCYDNLRGDKADSVYLLVNLTAVLLAARSLVWWAKLRRSVESQHAAGVALVVLEAVGLLVYRLSRIGLGLRSAWDFALAANVLLFIALCLIEVGALWNTRSCVSR